MNRYVLVTGGCGYIGSHVVRALALAGWTPIVYDDLSTGRPSNIDDHKLVQGSTLDSLKLYQTLCDNKIESVIHLAAKIEVGESVENPGKYFDHNVIGSLNLLRAMHAAGVKNLIFSSSAAVYGDENISRLSPVFKESDRPNPKNPYGVTKLFVEQAIEAFGKATDLKYANLRYFNAAGAHPQGDLYEHHKPETHLVPNVIAAATTKHILTVYGDGRNIRDYTHVWDIARAHVCSLAYLNAGNDSDTFNVGTGRGSTVLDVIRMVEKVSGYRVEYRHAEPRPGDPAVLIADNQKIYRAMDWFPYYDFEQIIWHGYMAWRNNGVIH